MEDVLIKSSSFKLPGKKKLWESEAEPKVIVIDVTESKIERPQKKQKRCYCGKKRNHTLKSQVVANQETGEIICTFFGQGGSHDFKIFKLSKLKIRKELICLGDKGYQGIKKYHNKSLTPKKKPKNSRLSQKDKRQNQQLARQRIIIEHINRKLKIFRILSEKYRNRRRRFGLRFNLIAGLYNYELMRANAIPS